MTIEEDTNKVRKTTGKGRRKDEAAFDRLSNLSRVTPSQLSHISFLDSCRYMPIRPLKVGFGGGGGTRGGGIFMMRDLSPDLVGEFLEFTSIKAIVVENSGNGAVSGGSCGSGRGGQDPDAELLEGPIAELPPSFEYDFDS